MSRKINICIFEIFLFSLAGCAQVHIKKSSNAPGEEGLPFYLPRPYVQVYEPFVIQSEVNIVSGSLSTDGQYVLIDNVKNNDNLGGIIKSDLEKDKPIKLAAKDIKILQTTQGPKGGPQGATKAPDSSTPNSAGAAAQDANPTPPKSDSSSSDASGANAQGANVAGTGNSSNSDKVGNSNITVTNTTSTYPSTLGRRFFDVVWMPDFEEKYVAQVSQGLGNSKVAMTLTQGWGLWGLDATVDNSAIVKPILDFYSTGLNALSKLAQSKILPASLLEGGAPQGAQSAANLAAGTRVTIKVTKVRVVAPGLYPILKPNEKYDASLGDQVADAKTMVRPTRPYTNIAFNTYDVVVIEAAKATGDTPMNMQRYFDSTATPSAPGASPSQISSPGAGAFDATEFETRVNALLKNRPGENGDYWKLSATTIDGSKLKTTATLANDKGAVGTKPSFTPEQLKAFLADQTGSKYSVTNIEVTIGK